jgi:hypothetical protein
VARQEEWERGLAPAVDGQPPCTNLNDLIYALPYSCIPTPRDARAVIEHLLETGWTPPWA